MPEVEVVIQMSKTCPFSQKECLREGCRLWSGQFDACGVAVNHLALVRVAEALQELAAHLGAPERSGPTTDGTDGHG